MVNLYIDESGTYYIGEPRYKFFLIASIIMTPEEDELAGLLMAKWRKKYLKNPNKCVHAVDFFEDRIKNYKRNQLRLVKNFSKAVDELLDIIASIDFTAEVFYVDLDQLRFKFGIPKPPVNSRKQIVGNKTYKQLKKEYHQLIINQMGSKTEYFPLKLCLFHAFNLHSQILQQEDENKGYINFESQSTSDGRFVDFYHQYTTSTPHYKYGEQIIGMDLHTKASLHGALEIADLVAYISMQNLRFQFRRELELEDLPTKRKINIRKIREVMRKKHHIKLTDVTSTSIDPSKKASLS